MISYHTCPVAALGGKNTGGMNVYVRELTKTLGTMGIQVDVFTRSEDEHVPHVVHDLGYGNRVVHIPAGPERPISKPDMVAYIDDFVTGILEFSARKSLTYDVIHSHYWMSGLAGKALKEAWDIPLVHMFHTLGLMKNRIAGEGEFEGDYRIHGELEVLRSVDKIVAATIAEQSQLQWLYEVPVERVTIIPPGVDTAHFHPIEQDEAREFIGVPTDQQLILFVGRIEPLKGIDILLRALGLLNEQKTFNSNACSLSIIGGDASVPREEMSHEMLRLHKLREELGLADFVTFLGKRGQDTLPYYYAAADVVVVPSHYESFGMVALEAMACGTAILASQVGGLAYLVQDGETGFHIKGNNIEYLADKLALVLGDAELRARLSHNAAIYAKQYDWGIIAERVAGLYYEVIQSTKR